MGAKKQAIIENLADAGCDSNFVEQYMRLEEAERVEEQLRMLACHRCTLLDALHIAQRKLECLDYLRYTVRKEHPIESTKPKKGRK